MKLIQKIIMNFEFLCNLNSNSKLTNLSVPSEELQSLEDNKCSRSLDNGELSEYDGVLSTFCNFIVHTTLDLGPRCHRMNARYTCFRKDANLNTES